MSEAKFTKGPWNWEYDNETASVLQIFSENEHEQGDPDICRIQSQNNANLIAAAPEMYEEIESEIEALIIESRNYVLESYELKSINARIDRKKKLLAKARGEL